MNGGWPPPFPDATVRGENENIRQGLWASYAGATDRPKVSNATDGTKYFPKYVPNYRAGGRPGPRLTFNYFTFSDGPPPPKLVNGGPASCASRAVLQATREVRRAALVSDPVPRTQTHAPMAHWHVRAPRTAFFTCREGAEPCAQGSRAWGDMLPSASALALLACDCAHGVVLESCVLWCEHNMVVSDAMHTTRYHPYGRPRWSTRIRDGPPTQG